LSIMQHYGAPTRLLDWTYSLPIATYFVERRPQFCRILRKKATFIHEAARHFLPCNFDFTSSCHNTTFSMEISMRAETFYTIFCKRRMWKRIGKKEKINSFLPKGSSKFQ
jgi:hypothetical protein